MVKTRNSTQWEQGYPDCVISQDIENGNCYVEEESGTIHGVFVCIPGEDPTYQVMKDGQWLNGRPYAAVHRIGTDGTVPGFFDRCVALCPDLRMDTHENNHVMQHLLETSSFRHCGRTITHDGTARLAYQLET